MNTSASTPTRHSEDANNRDNGLDGTLPSASQRASSPIPTSPTRDPHHKRKPKRISATFGGPGSIPGSRSDSGSGSSYSAMTAGTPTSTNSPLSPLFMSFTQAPPSTLTHSPTTLSSSALRQQDQYTMVSQHPLDHSPASLGVSNTGSSNVRRQPLVSGTFGFGFDTAPTPDREHPIASTIDLAKDSQQHQHQSERRNDRVSSWSSTSASESRDGTRARARFTFGYDDTDLSQDILKILPPSSSPPDNDPIEEAPLPPLPLSSTVHSPRIHSTTRVPPQSSNSAAADLTLADAVRYDHNSHGLISTSRQPRHNSSVVDHTTLMSPQLQGQQETSKQNLRPRHKQRLSFLVNMFMSTTSSSPAPSSPPLSTVNSAGFATGPSNMSTATGANYNVIEKPLPPVPFASRSSHEAEKFTTLIPLSEMPERLTATATSAMVMAHTDMHVSSGALSSHDSEAADSSSSITPHYPAATTSNKSSTTLCMVDSGFLVSAPTKSKRNVFGVTPSAASSATSSPQPSTVHVNPFPMQAIQRPEFQDHSRRISIASVLNSDLMMASPVVLSLKSSSSSSTTNHGGAPYFGTSQDSLVITSTPFSHSPLTPASENTLSNLDLDDNGQRSKTGPRRQHQGHRHQHSHSSHHYHQSKPQYRVPHGQQARHDDQVVLPAAIAPNVPAAATTGHPGKVVSIQDLLTSPSALSLTTPPRSSSLHTKNLVVDGDGGEMATKTKKRKRGFSLSLFCICLKK